MDEIRVWSYVSTEEEIAADMDCMLIGEEEGLLLYWLMEEGSGQTLEDWTGNGWTGQLGATSASDR